MIDRFSKAEFEAALPKHKITGKPLWEPLGIVHGELRYRIPVADRPGLFVNINSSIGWYGRADDSGKNSIRIWVSDENDNPMFKKEDAWTTRVAGWQFRMVEKIRSQYKKALQCHRCPDCNSWMVVRSGKNGDFLGCSNYPRCRHTEDLPEEQLAGTQLRMKLHG